MVTAAHGSRMSGCGARAQLLPSTWNPPLKAGLEARTCSAASLLPWMFIWTLWLSLLTDLPDSLPSSSMSVSWAPLCPQGGTRAVKTRGGGGWLAAQSAGKHPPVGSQWMTKRASRDHTRVQGHRLPIPWSPETLLAKEKNRLRTAGRVTY